ncbi:MAG: ABC transporter permease [Lachnospiraceae bacterium]|nr:ABC transporter permease [Lachnospiraceae bacterium]
MIRNIKAILWKQIKDTFKNKTILIQFIMFPVLTLLMENAVNIEELPEHFFVKLFAVMYVGMAPLTAMSAVISEEKEKNTLRVLLMSNVKSMEYLLGVGIYIWAVCMIGAGVFSICGKYKGSTLCAFMLIMAVGILVSILIGAAIGTWSKNQMMATSVTVPVMMVVSFLPMLSMFNTSIEKLEKLTYSGQIHTLIGNVENLEISVENVLVICINMAIAVLGFWFSYRRSGLE